MEKRKNILESSLDSLLNNLETFSKVFLIVALGFILRMIAAINLDVSADDMHFAVHAINFLNSGKLVVYDQSASLWYYLTDIFYKFLGVTQLGSRFVPVLFGTLSIFLIFLYAKKFFDRKVALFSSLLLAISIFHIKNTIAEMDVLAVFFSLFSLYLIILSLEPERLKKEKILFVISSAILLGLAILTKVYALLFIPVIVFYIIIKRKRKLKDKGNLKFLALFLGIVFLFCLPSITHNYLLYKDKGMTDLMYANMLKIMNEKNTEYYSWDTGYGHNLDIKSFFLGNSPNTGDIKWPTAIYTLSFLATTDFLIFIFGILGFFLAYKKNKDYLVLSALIIIFVFSFIGARIYMPKHFIFLLIVFIPSASLFLSKLDDSLKNIFKFYKTGFLIFILIAFSIILLGNNSPNVMMQSYSKSGVAQLMDYKNDIPDSALVVADSRIYRGQIHWVFNGKNYIESANLQNLIDFSNSLEGQKLPTDLYFVECVTDDCGWGTIQNQPDFNQSVEQMVTFFQNQSQLKKEIYVADQNRPYWPFISDKGILQYRIYKTTVMINRQAFDALKQTKVWFLYPIGYDESIQQIFDKYQTHNFLDFTLDKLAHLIVYLSIVFSFLSILFLIYLFLNEK